MKIPGVVILILLFVAASVFVRQAFPQADLRLVVQAPVEMIISISFSPDGESVIVGTQGGATNIENVSAEILETRTGRLIRTIRYVDLDAAEEEAWMEAVGISPDNLMFYGSAGDDLIWDSATGDTFRRLPKGVAFAAFVPGTKSIYVTTALKANKKVEVVKLWDLRSRMAVRVLTNADKDSTRPSRDGRHLTTMLNGSISVWNTVTGKLTAAVPNDGYENFEPSHSGLIVASKGSLVRIIDMKTGARAQEFLTENPVRPAADRREPNKAIGAVRLLADGRSVLVYGSSGLKIHDAKTGAILRDVAKEADGLVTDEDLLSALRDSNHELTFDISPEGNRFALARSELQVLDISSGVTVIDTVPSAYSDEETDESDLSEVGNTGLVEVVVSAEEFQAWELTDDPEISQRKGLLRSTRLNPIEKDYSFSDIAFSSKDHFAMAVSETAKELWLFETLSGKLVTRTPGLTSEEPFDDSERFFAFTVPSGSGSTIKIANTSNGEITHHFGVGEFVSLWFDEESSVLNVIDSSRTTLNIRKIDCESKSTVSLRRVTLPFAEFESSVSGDGSAIALYDGNQIVHLDLTKKTRPWIIQKSHETETIELTHDGEYLVWVSDSVEVGNAVTRSSRKLDFDVSPELTREIYLSDDDETLGVFQSVGTNGMGQARRDMAIFELRTGVVAAEMWHMDDPDGDFKIEGDIVHIDGDIYVLDPDHPVKATFGDKLTGVGLRKLATIHSLGGSRWLVVDENSRFDTNDVEGISNEVHWVATDKPLRMLPLEMFIRQYYEPGLLRRLLECTNNSERPCNREFKRLPRISQINRVQSLVAEPQPAHPRMTARSHRRNLR